MAEGEDMAAGFRIALKQCSDAGHPVEGVTDMGLIAAITAATTASPSSTFSQPFDGPTMSTSSGPSSSASNTSGSSPQSSQSTIPNTGNRNALEASVIFIAFIIGVLLSL